MEKLKAYAGISEESIVTHNKLAATTVCRKFLPQKICKKEFNPTVFKDDYMEKYEKSPEKLAIWENEGISMATLDKFQVYYDSFSNRLVYPIRDFDGRIVNIGGRTLDPEWKEKGLRKYTYFSGWGGGMGVIYGLFDNLDAIKNKHEVIIFEGCKSVLLADTWGIHNTAALLTSHLSPAQMKLLVKLGCDVVFALDKEIRIREDHNIKRLKQYVNVSYLWDKSDLTDDKDSPVDKGLEVFNELYNNRLVYR